MLVVAPTRLGYFQGASIKLQFPQNTSDVHAHLLAVKLEPAYRNIHDVVTIQKRLPQQHPIRDPQVKKIRSCDINLASQIKNTMIYTEDI